MAFTIDERYDARDRRAHYYYEDDTTNGPKRLLPSDMARVLIESRVRKDAIKRLRQALSMASWRCEHVHHPKHMQHGVDEPCPVEAFIQETLEEVE